MSDKNTASCTMTLKVNKGKTLSSQESSHANSYYDRFLQCPRRENPFLSKCDSQAISVRATVRPSLHHTPDREAREMYETVADTCGEKRARLLENHKMA